jgi:DNA-binding LacI/PurR family transcriptional regulator/DNA-binding transcriptional regulator YhcF (GntR family)
MEPLRVLSASEQVAAYLRRALLGGEWGGRLPGGNQLADRLGTGRNTVEAALQLLEDEGLLVPQGPGRRRLVRLPKKPARQALRVAILLDEAAARKADYLIELRNELNEMGQVAFFAEHSMVGLGMDVKRIARMVGKTEADAWVVLAGSHDLLEWFVKRKLKAFALFGRRRGFAMAGVGPDKPAAMAAATRALIGLGHRRIVLMARTPRRKPEPGASERAFLGELSAHGIIPGPYHLPDWKETIGGFHERLEALFQVTPPTALIVDESPFFIAARNFLAERGLRVPEDVSMVCTDADPAFDWCRTSIAHIRWDTGPVVRRVVRWADRVAHGMEDLRQRHTPAEFVAGGTIGPVGCEAFDAAPDSGDFPNTDR